MRKKDLRGQMFEGRVGCGSSWMVVEGIEHGRHMVGLGVGLGEVECCNWSIGQR